MIEKGNNAEKLIKMRNVSNYLLSVKL